MTERDFELLEILAETKNITRAAELLYITQSALSKRIAAIEQELGTTIMLRSRQGIHLTPEGEDVIRYTREAARSLKQMREAIELNRDYISGTLNAGISINYAQYSLPDILASYRKHFPHVNTHIITDQSRNIYQLALDGIVDVAVVRGEYPWKENRILLEREKICAIRSLADKNRPLKEIPYIARKTDVGFQREATQWMRENGLSPNLHGIIVDSINTCVEMVTRGLGWAIVPEICLKQFSGYVSPLSFANGEPFVRSTYLIYTESVLALPQANAFINIVRNSSTVQQERGEWTVN